MTARIVEYLVRRGAQRPASMKTLLGSIAALFQPKLDDVQVEGVAELLLACLFGMGNREFTHPRLDEAQTAAVVAHLLLGAAARA